MDNNSWTDDVATEMKNVFVSVATQAGDIIAGQVIAQLEQRLAAMTTNDSDNDHKAIADQITQSLVDPSNPLMHSISASVATALAMATHSQPPVSTPTVDTAGIQEMVRVTVRQELASLMEQFVQYASPAPVIDVDVVVERLQQALALPRATDYVNEFADEVHQNENLEDTVFKVASDVDVILKSVMDIKTDLSISSSTPPSGTNSAVENMLTTTNKRVDDLYNYLQRQLANLTKDIRQLDSTAVALRSLVDNQIAESQAATRAQLGTFTDMLDRFQQQIAAENTEMKEQFNTWTAKLEQIFAKAAKAKEEEVRVLANRIEDSAIRKTFEGRTPFSKKKA